MSSNIAQIFIANPITTNNVTDLMYFGVSGVDAAMTYGSFAAQFQKSSVNYSVDTGVSGAAYVATLSPAPASLADGLTVILKPANTNSVNNPTLNVNGLGAKTILADGYNLDPVAQGDIQQDIDAVFQYNAANNAFMLLNPQLTMAAPFNVQSGLYDVVRVDTGTTNAVVGDSVFYPGLATFANGTRVFQHIGNTNTGATTYQFAGLAAFPVVLADGTALSGGELVSGSWALLVFNGTSSKWQLMNPFSASGGSGPFTQAGSYSAYGPGAVSTMGISSLALGNFAEADGNYALAIGSGARAGGRSTVATGLNASATGNYSIVMGDGINDNGFSSNVLIGCISASSGGAGNVNIGGNNSNGSYGVALGAGSSNGSGQYQISIGFGAAQGNGAAGIAIGHNAVATGHNAICLGEGAKNTNGFNGVFSIVDSSGTPAPDSAADQFIPTFAGGYYFYHNSTTLHFSCDADGNLINNKGTADQSYSLQTPLAGDSITIADGSKSLVLDPAGTLATLTIVMPPNPVDGQEIRVSTSKVITVLTLSPNTGQTLANAPTTLNAGNGFAYLYNLSGTKWYRLY